MEAWPPEHCEHVVSFEVRGMPRPGGSKNAVPLGRREKGTGRFIPYTRKDGTPITNLVDASGENGANWRADIREAAISQLRGELDELPDLEDGPLAVRVTFTYPGPEGRYGTGRNASVLKDTADAFPHQGKLADGTKLARALEDALNEVVWTDDRRICDLWWSRRFHGTAGARVDVYRMPRSIAELRGSVTVETSDEGDQLVLADDRSVIMDDDGDTDCTEALAV